MVFYDFSWYSFFLTVTPFDFWSVSTTIFISTKAGQQSKPGMYGELYSIDKSTPIELQLQNNVSKSFRWDWKFSSDRTFLSSFVFPFKLTLRESIDIKTETVAHPNYGNVASTTSSINSTTLANHGSNNNTTTIDRIKEKTTTSPTEDPYLFSTHTFCHSTQVWIRFRVAAEFLSFRLKRPNKQILSQKRKDRQRIIENHSIFALVVVLIVMYTFSNQVLVIDDSALIRRPIPDKSASRAAETKDRQQKCRSPVVGLAVGRSLVVIRKPSFDKIALI